jgi:NitT/TauT family transport system ATP-binding protein
VHEVIRPDIPRTDSPEAIRRDRVYLDTTEAIWQILKQYVA